MVIRRNFDVEVGCFERSISPICPDTRSQVTPVHRSTAEGTTLAQNAIRSRVVAVPSNAARQ
jgi:hypothetical protein